tara:strand:+ start:729 stop:1664 length:936 start_codon:yes stop_codon:yes gene_type:complete
MKKKNRILITWRDLIFDYKSYKKYFNSKRFIVDFLVPKQFITEKKLLTIIHKYDGIICGDDEITQRVIDKAKKLKVISKWGTGIDSINKSYATKKKIKVFNVKNAFTKEVAAYAVAILLYLTRALSFSDNSLKKYSWKKYRGISLYKKNLGIVGFGRIGQEIARLAKPFGLKILIYDIIDKSLNAKRFSAKKVSYENLLENSDFIIFSPNLNKKSVHMFDFEIQKFIKKRPCIINISRGKIINEKFLKYAIKTNIISQIGLDVFNNEPINKKNILISKKNNYFSAHNAYNTEESVRRTNLAVVKNLLKVLK